MFLTGISSTLPMPVNVVIVDNGPSADVEYDHFGSLRGLQDRGGVEEKGQSGPN